MSGKRYYWLKLKDDFFTSKRIKKLRAMAGGDTYLIIYLKMQLLALKSEGVLQWTGLEEKFTDELALDLDEKPDDVAVTLMYLLKTGLAETSDNINFFFPYVVENTGSEGASAQRWRDWKARQVLETNTTLTERKQITNGEKEIEKEKDIEIEKEYKAPEAKRFIAPSIEEVKSYCEERQNNVNAQQFVDFYSAKGWMVGKNKMKDWKACVRTWEQRDDKPKHSKQYVTASEYKNPCEPMSKEKLEDLKRRLEQI